MKLYATIRASKLENGMTKMYKQVSKSQGSNNQINIEINIDSEVPRYRLHINKRDDDSTDICLVDLHKAYPFQEVFRDTIKGEKKKGECKHSQPQACCATCKWIDARS